MQQYHPTFSSTPHNRGILVSCLTNDSWRKFSHVRPTIRYVAGTTVPDQSDLGSCQILQSHADFNMTKFSTSSSTAKTSQKRKLAQHLEQVDPERSASQLVQMKNVLIFGKAWHQGVEVSVNEGILGILAFQSGYSLCSSRAVDICVTSLTPNMKQAMNALPIIRSQQNGVNITNPASSSSSLFHTPSKTPL